MQRPAQRREPGQGVAGKTEPMTDHNPDAGLQQRSRQGWKSVKKELDGGAGPKPHPLHSDGKPARRPHHQDILPHHCHPVPLPWKQGSKDDHPIPPFRDLKNGDASGPSREGCRLCAPSSHPGQATTELASAHKEDSEGTWHRQQGCGEGANQPSHYTPVRGNRSPAQGRSSWK